MRSASGRGFLLVPFAAIVVHQLRYSLAYGGRANAELAAQGHSYLHSLVPWAIFALAVGGGLFLRRLAEAARTGDPGRSSRLPDLVVWLASWIGLLAIYAVQEALEATLAVGHPGGVGGVFGHGGWWAVPVSAVVAAIVTLLLRAGRALLRVAADAHRAPVHVAEAVSLPSGVAPAVIRPLALNAAGRAPPARLPVR
jgi:hypothetical protein